MTQEELISLLKSYIYPIKIKRTFVSYITEQKIIKQFPIKEAQKAFEEMLSKLEFD